MGSSARASTLAEVCLRAAHTHGPATAVHDGTERLTYADLGRRALHFAHALVGSRVRPGDRVLISAPNSVGWVVAAFGVALSGATIVPVNDRVTGTERRRVVEELGPMTVISEQTGGWGPQSRVLALADLLAWSGEHGTLPLVTPDMVALVMQTSGTTGTAKFVPMRHGPLTALYTDLSRRIGLTPRDVALGPVPLAHGFGLFGVLLDGLLAGACVRLVRRYEPGTVADLVAMEQVTAILAPPTVFHDLMVSGRKDIGDRCRIALTGGTSVSLPWFHETCDALGIERRLVGYGMTEAYGAIAFGDVTDQRSEALPKLAPLPGVEMEIVDVSGSPQGRDAPGEIRVRGASVLVDATGWLDTGDLGRLTRDGRLVVLSRLTDTVIVSGFNVDPVEVEQVLRSQPGVVDAAVLGVPDPRRGELLVGCVVMSGSAPFDRASLDAACRARLAPYKVPVELIELTAVPTTYTGKRSRRILRELVVRRRAEQHASHVGDRQQTADPTVDRDHDPVDVRRVVTGQEARHPGDVLGGTEPP